MIGTKNADVNPVKGCKIVLLLLLFDRPATRHHRWSEAIKNNIFFFNTIFFLLYKFETQKKWRVADDCSRGFMMNRWKRWRGSEGRRSSLSAAAASAAAAETPHLEAAREWVAGTGSGSARTPSGEAAKAGQHAGAW
jgi:hypothetical protein